MKSPSFVRTLYAEGLPIAGTYTSSIFSRGLHNLITSGGGDLGMAGMELHMRTGEEIKERSSSNRAAASPSLASAGSGGLRPSASTVKISMHSTSAQWSLGGMLIGRPFRCCGDNTGCSHTIRKLYPIRPNCRVVSTFLFYSRGAHQELGHESWPSTSVGPRRRHQPAVPITSSSSTQHSPTATSRIEG